MEAEVKRRPPGPELTNAREEGLTSELLCPRNADGPGLIGRDRRWRLIAALAHDERISGG